jgi:hypothetical protein
MNGRVLIHESTLVALLRDSESSQSHLTVKYDKETHGTPNQGPLGADEETFSSQ